MTLSRGILLLGAAGALAVAGCGGDDNNDSSKTTSTAKESGAVKAPGATVKITTPSDGSTTGRKVTAHVTLSNFQLAPAQVGKKAVAGQGHLHFALDGGKFDFPKYSGANGKLAQQLGVEGKYSPSVTPTITYRNLPPGKHELEVYLANNDHTNTGTEGKTEFTVQ